MSSESNSTIEAIGKLKLLTQRGAIKWISEDPGNVPKNSAEEVINSVYITQYGGRYLRIFRRKYRAQELASLHSALIGRDNEPKKYHWRTEVILELLDEAGLSAWQFPKEKILQDLLATVKYTCSGADDLIRDLLNE